MSGTVAIVTLGCKTNQFESAAMSEQLRAAGYQQVDIEEGAELVIVNTCTVTAATDSQSRNLVRRARRANPHARVVVTGCYAQVDPQALAQLPGVALVIGNEEKQDFLSRLTALDDSRTHVEVSDIRQTELAVPLSLSRFDQRSRAFVQIQNGCDAFCSYCIIPYARGRSRSVALPAIISQVEQLAATGYPEVVLTGIHIGNYGQDLQPKADLLALLQALEQTDYSGRLRLGSIEPTEIPPTLREYAAASRRICPHWHIPLQAGDDEILQRMNRHYSTNFFHELVCDIRRRQPDAAIGLDVISGFPGETEQQFNTTLKFLDGLPFSHLHVFPFSKRPGTPAAEMIGQLPGDIIKQRASILRDLGERKLAEFSRSFIGRELEVVIEGGAGDGRCKGLSENYLNISLPSAGLAQGSCRQVTITGESKGNLVGVLGLAVL